MEVRKLQVGDFVWIAKERFGELAILEEPRISTFPQVVGDFFFIIKPGLNLLLYCIVEKYSIKPNTL